MKSSCPILAMLLGVSACSARQLGAYGDADVVGSNDVGTRDADADVLGTSDAGTADAGTGDIGGRHQPLCDGVPHLRVAAAYVGGGQIGRGSRVRIENGYQMFAVDGTCAYWIAAGWAGETFSEDRPIRTGKLSDADVLALEESLPLDDIESLENGCDPNSIPDAPTRSIRTATGDAICGLAAARFDPAWKAVTTVATGLANEGTPVDGPLHVSASRPVNDPDAASQLRALRDQYLVDKAAQPGLHPGGGLIATDQNVMVVVYMRDAIPYEDAQGLLAF